jgi:hypothetical protein
VDVEPSLYEELHGVRLAINTGTHQGRVAVLQRGAGREGFGGVREGQGGK